MHRQNFDATVSDNYNGTCSVVCVPVIEGDHDIFLQIGETNLPKLRIHVDASKISPENCIISTVNKDQSLQSCRSGGECECRIISYDRFKNKIDLKSDGSETFKVYATRKGASNINTGNFI